MDFKRVILYSALFLASISLLNAWQKDFPAKGAAATQAASNISSNDIPTVSALQTMTAKTDPSPNELINTSIPAERLIHIKTDIYDIAIDKQGGNIIEAKLLGYPVSVKDKSPIKLLNSNQDSLFIAQSGLLSKEGPDSPKGQAIYTAEKQQYDMVNGQDKLTVTLLWKNEKGITVSKNFEFTRGKYVIGVNYHIQNNSKSPWSGNLYTQLKRKDLSSETGGFFNVRSYMGAAISSSEKPFEKISFKNMTKSPLNREIKGGWAAMVEHYFLSAWVPDNQNEYHYYTKVHENDVYSIGMLGNTLQVAPASSLETSAKLYIGPELTEQLKSVAPHLDLTIDYGFLWFLGIGIFWLMQHIHSVVHNWGWSIVFVTILIKLAFYHLSATSYKSMANMRKLQPKMEALKARFADDRQKMTQATMELYKKEKINPLGGCLPILVQIPVFLALYWVLIESVQLRQAPFILWIQDLSVRDPYFILPILMGISMFVQQQLNPPPPDPMQAKIMMFLPVFFTALFASFPAGLVLYWFVNNSVSILQQWYIMRKVEQSGKKKSNVKLAESN